MVVSFLKELVIDVATSFPCLLKAGKRPILRRQPELVISFYFHSTISISEFMENHIFFTFSIIVMVYDVIKVSFQEPLQVSHQTSHSPVYQISEEDTLGSTER